MNDSENQLNKNGINSFKYGQNIQPLLKTDKLIYEVPGILLIFNNITIDFNSFYRLDYIKNKISFEEIIKKLEEQLGETTFNEKLKNNNIKSIINDYYKYFVLKNKSLEKKKKDYKYLFNLIEEICNIKFNFNKKETELNTKEFLKLLIWCNIYYLELNEFLYCVLYYNSLKFFKKVNIYNEITNKYNEFQKNNDKKEEQTDEFALSKFIEILISILSKEEFILNPEYIEKIQEIMPIMYNINERKKLSCKELYTFIEYISIYKAINKESNIDKNEKIEKLKKLIEILKQCKEYFINNDDLNIISKFEEIKKEIINKDNLYYLYIQILLQEYKIFKDNENFLDVLMKILLNDKLKLIKYSHIIFNEILSKYIPNNNENKDIENIELYENDYFLKLIKKIKEEKGKNKEIRYLEEIILEVFETKFNSFFEDNQNIENNPKDIIKQNEFKDKIFIKCINLLEKNEKIIKEQENKKIDTTKDINLIHSELFIPNIFYSAYIKCYLYKFIYYVYYEFKNSEDNNNENENNIIKEIENKRVEYIKKIIELIKGKDEKEENSQVRKVIQIYTFRLIYYFCDKNYSNFKKYIESSLFSYKENFANEESIEEQNPKFIDYCVKSIEDYLNIDDEDPKNITKEQNYYIHSYLSINLVGRASNKDEYKNIHKYLKNRLKDKTINLDIKSTSIDLDFEIRDDLLKT